MASIIRCGSGRRPSFAVQFTDSEQNRKTIRLGQIKSPDAIRVRLRIETLVECLRVGMIPDPETQAWLEALSDKFHEKLVRVGLTSPRAFRPVCPKLSVFLKNLIAERQDSVSKNDIRLLGQARDKLVIFFSDDPIVSGIKRDGAAAWQTWLQTPKTRGGAGLAKATTRTHTRYAKLAFKEAVARGFTKENPFSDLRSAAVASTHNTYILSQDASRVMDALPDASWRALFALARFAGLRVPSETHILKWDDVDLEAQRLRVFAPKTKSVRYVPITRPVSQALQEAFDACPVGKALVINLSRNNLNRTVEAAIRRAGLERWKRLFQTLRCSCECDWAQHFPQHAVSEWLGHSMAVSEKHYLRATDELFVRASRLWPVSALQNALQPDDVNRCLSCAPTSLDQSATEWVEQINSSEATRCKEGQQVTAKKENGPARTRTWDRAIMSRLL